jgi:hypothetical protein
MAGELTADAQPHCENPLTYVTRTHRTRQGRGSGRDRRTAAAAPGAVGNLGRAPSGRSTSGAGGPYGGTVPESTLRSVSRASPGQGGVHLLESDCPGPQGGWRFVRPGPEARS